MKKDVQGSETKARERGGRSEFSVEITLINVCYWKGEDTCHETRKKYKQPKLTGHSCCGISIAAVELAAVGALLTIRLTASN